MKPEMKDILDNLPKEVSNPFRIMKLWARWEMLDISAIIEAIEIKSKLEGRKADRISSKESNKKDLEKLNNGKNTLTSMFMSKDGKVNKITSLTRVIS